MRLSKQGLMFLHGSEGCRLVAYLDTGGVPTIGWGSTRMFGKPVHLGMTCTQSEADAQAMEDLDSKENAIISDTKVALSQNQFDALVSLVYNIGEGAFAKSTLLKKLNLGDYLGAADEFMRWIYDNGKEVEGLKNRRRNEKKLFLEK